jgi:hypothetical protein
MRVSVVLQRAGSQDAIGEVLEAVVKPCADVLDAVHHQLHSVSIWRAV